MDFLIVPAFVLQIRGRIPSVKALFMQFVPLHQVKDLFGSGFVDSVVTFVMDCPYARTTYLVLTSD
jgi:hypothetical protein